MANYHDIAALKFGIRAFVNELASMCLQPEPIDHIGAFLVAGVVRCGAAYGGSLWISNDGIWSRRNTTLRLVASIGRGQSPDFAQEVAAKDWEILRNDQLNNAEVLLMGVPIRRDGFVVGAITIVQRSESPLESQRGFTHFMNQVAQVFATCPLLAA